MFGGSFDILAEQRRANYYFGIQRNNPAHLREITAERPPREINVGAKPTHTRYPRRASCSPPAGIKRLQFAGRGFPQRV